MQRKPITYDRLPEPDAFGAYWFGPVGGPNTSVIYPFKADKRRRENRLYFLCTPDGSAMFDGSVLKEFANPEVALIHLRRFIKRNRL